MKATFRSGGARRFGRIFVVLAGLSALPCPSWAQSDEERAAARQAALEGIKALREQRYPAAIDLLTRAESVVHAPTHLLYLARAQAGMEQLVRARENYMKIVKENIDPSKPKAFHDAKQDAEKELAALEPRIPAITTVVEGAQGKPVTVTVDGNKVPSALVGLPRPVDPGEHRLQASAEGMASDIATINVREGSNEKVTLVLKPGAAPVVASSPPPPEPSGPSSLPPPMPVPPGPPSSPEQPKAAGGSPVRTAGFVVAGLGVVGVGVGTIFYLGGVSKQQESDDACQVIVLTGKCKAGTQDTVNTLDDEAKSKKTMGIIALAAGGVAAVAGVTMIVVGKPKPTPVASPSFTPWIGLGQAGVSGTF
jgi:hypothetical protein